jgi:putative spermidine/putrescine transport system substrate-binding protein
LNERRGLSRKGFLKGSGVAVGGLYGGSLLAACGGDDEPAATGGGGGANKALDGISTITVVNWGGTTSDAMKEAWAKPFTKATGIDVKLTSPIDYGKFKVQIEGGNVDWNWIDSEGYFPFGNSDLLADVRPEDFGLTASDFVEFDNNVTPKGVASYLSSHVIAYRTDKDGPHPTDWVEFFDTKGIPGKRALYNYPYAMLEIALLGDGVAYDDLYPLDVDRAFDKIDSIRDDLIFFNTGAESQQFLVGDSADFVTPWHNRAGYLALGGLPIGIEWNQQVLLCTYHVIPRGDEKAPADKEFIKTALEPENQLEFARLSGLAPSRVQAVEKVDERLKPLMPTTAENWDKAAGFTNDEWWGENYVSVSEKWYEWVGA